MSTQAFTIVQQEDGGWALWGRDGAVARVGKRDAGLGGYVWDITEPQVLESDQRGWTTPHLALRHAASYARVTPEELRAATDAIYVAFGLNRPWEPGNEE